MEAPPSGLLQRVMAALRRQALVLKAASFASIGVVNTLVDLCLFLLSLKFLTSSLIVANVLAWTVAVSGSYAMNSYITFAAELGRRLNPRAYATFVASQILGLLAATATLVLAATGDAGDLCQAARDRRELPGQFFDLAFRGVSQTLTAAGFSSYSRGPDCSRDISCRSESILRPIRYFDAVRQRQVDPRSGAPAQRRVVGGESADHQAGRGDRRAAIRPAAKRARADAVGEALARHVISVLQDLDRTGSDIADLQPA